MKQTVLYAILLAVICSMSSCKERNTPEYRYHLYDEPCLIWANSKTQVETWMRNKGFVKNQETTSGSYRLVVYNARLLADLTSCVFTSNGTYMGAVVYLKRSNFTPSELAGFLTERYVYDSSDGTYTYMHTKDNKTTVAQSQQYVNSVLYTIITYSPR